MIRLAVTVRWWSGVAELEKHVVAPVAAVVGSRIGLSNRLRSNGLRVAYCLLWENTLIEVV